MAEPEEMAASDADSDTPSGSHNSRSFECFQDPPKVSKRKRKRKPVDE